MAEQACVLGHPVAHSKSPAMHNAAYEALGWQWEYGFKDCPDEESARAFLSERTWRACNITMPWKPLAFALADRRSQAAELAGGANVLVNWEGRLHADNTDGKGCVAFLQRCGVCFAGSSVSVCGTGPTSLSILHACLDAGARSVALHGRNLERTQAIVADYRGRIDLQAGASVEAFSYDGAGADVLKAAQVIIDATPLGMKPQDPAPFDTSLLSSNQVVMDVVYGHGVTKLRADAAACGGKVFDGAGMLVAQAVATIEDIARITEAYSIPGDVDLFAVMAQAAGFDLPVRA